MYYVVFSEGEIEPEVEAFSGTSTSSLADQRVLYIYNYIFLLDIGHRIIIFLFTCNPESAAHLLSTNMAMYAGLTLLLIKLVSEDSLIDMMEYLIDNIYIKVGNKVFRQFSMGTDCAPLLANLFLFYYEYKYMKNLVKDNLQVAMKFNGTMRYIDDLLTLNNRGFASKIPDIYPPELDLKTTTESPTTVSYLDILITINNGQYATAVYDKRDSFNFSIVNFPYLSSNIPSKPAYGVYISQLVRIGRICDNFEQFNDRHYKVSGILGCTIF